MSDYSEVAKALMLAMQIHQHQSRKIRECKHREEGDETHSVNALSIIAEEFNMSYHRLSSGARAEDCFLCKNIDSCSRAVAAKKKYNTDIIYKVARELGMLYVPNMLEVIPPFNEELSDDSSEMIEGLGETNYAERRVISWAIFLTQTHNISRKDAINHVETLEMEKLNSLGVSNLYYSTRLSALRTLIPLK